MKLFLPLVLPLYLAALPALADGHLMPLFPLPEDEARDWPAIGRVFDPLDPNRGFCSGTLVARDVVLTAGHCSGAATRPKPDDQLQFLAGAFNSDTAATRRIVRQIRNPIYRSGGHHTPDFDIGLWLLDSPITDIAPLSLGAPDGDIFALLGYHKAVPFRLSGRTDCPLTALEPGLITVGCRVIGGNSGSPVLEARPDGSHEVVAVTSSQDGGNAIAVRIGAWVREALHRHASN
ncbi:MAG: trypsin-like serine protease [Pseudomonadota bacterium]